MVNEVIKNFENLAEELLLKIKPTVTDLHQFERNLRNSYVHEHISGSLEHIKKHKAYIGSKVLKYESKFSYTTLKEWEATDVYFKGLNKVESKELTFTEEHFKDFLIKYIDFQIEYITHRFLNNNVTCNSTNKLTNIAFEYQIEENQSLYKFLKKQRGILIGS